MRRRRPAPDDAAETWTLRRAFSGRMADGAALLENMTATFIGSETCRERSSRRAWGDNRCDAKQRERCEGGEAIHCCPSGASGTVKKSWHHDAAHPL
jgi:hypothetical protein